VKVFQCFPPYQICWKFCAIDFIDVSVTDFYGGGQAVELLKEVVRLAPNVADSYHTLGLLYDAKGDREKALNFYMIAAHLTPKDIVLWKRLASWSM
jgi:hypothetical protein